VVEYLPLSTAFDLGVSGAGLQDDDRLRVVSEASVPVCGSLHSSEPSRHVAGAGTGERTSGDWTYSEWRGMAPMAMGSYLACFCGRRPGMCCDSDADFVTELRHLVVPGVSNDHYVICEVTVGAIKTCQVLGLSGHGLQEGDMLMVQDGTNCGLGSAVPGFYNGAVMVSRVPNALEELGEHPPGTFFRFEATVDQYLIGGKPSGIWRYAPQANSVATGGLGLLCWCSVTKGCDPGQPSDFTIQAGYMAYVRQDSDLAAYCYELSSCSVRVSIQDFQPIRDGDRLLVMQADEPEERLLGCDGNLTVGLGPAGDGYSAIAVLDSDEAVFDLGSADVAVGIYRLCWCQNSQRPCDSASDFNYDIGYLEVQEAGGGYIWPDCTYQSLTFTDWRQGRWLTFDDCCCNYAEAGSRGCWDTNSDAYSRCLAVER